MKIQAHLINERVSFLIHHKDIVYIHRTKFRCPNEQWNLYNKRFKHDFDINMRLDEIEIELQDVSMKTAVRRKNNTLDGFKIEVHSLDFLSYLESNARWVDTAKLLRRFDPKANWDNMTQEYLLRFKDWLLLEAKKKDGTHYAVNTYVLHYTLLKNSMTAAIRNGNQLANQKMFGLRIKKEESIDIYLTESELKRIEMADLPLKLDPVRVMFLVGCYSGARFSDFKNLSSVNIVGNKLKYMSQKTGANISVPLHPYVKKQLELGLKSVGDRVNKNTESKYFNSRIKEICKISGVNEDILTYSKVAGEPLPVRKPKWAMVHSHTARKTFATNLALNQIPIIAIQKFLGHKDITVTSRYILCDSDDFDSVVMSSQYFSGKSSPNIKAVEPEREIIEVAVIEKPEVITAKYYDKNVVVIGKGRVAGYLTIKDESGEVFSVSERDLYFG
jgi:integrase